MIARIAAIAVFFSVLGLFFIIHTSTKTTSLCDNLHCISVTGQQTFSRKELYADTGETYRALYTTPDRTLRIEARKVSANLSEIERKAAVTRIKAMFEKAPAPYPGELSDAIVCDPDYIPIYREATSSAGTRLSLFTGYLNNRLTFGSCSEDQAVNKGILAFMYCPASSLFIKLELIQPTSVFEAAPEEIEKQLFTVACEN